MASAESPAGLVHVDRARRADTRKDVVAGLSQRVGGPREDRVDRAGADARSKQLLAELDEVAAADAVADRQHRDRGLIARPERALTDADGQLAAPPAPAARAAHALAAMLGHGDRDRRQLLDLMACRVAIADQLALGEDVSAAALAGPVIDELIDRPRRQQRAALALMPRLGARLAARWILAAPRRRAWRIGAGWLRRIARGARQLALQRRDPLVLASDLRGQLLDLRLKPLVLRRQRQQHRHDRIATLPIDRLGLAALHTPAFAVSPLCPPPTERLRKATDTRDSLKRSGEGIDLSTAGLRRPAGFEEGSVLAATTLDPR